MVLLVDNHAMKYRRMIATLICLLALSTLGGCASTRADLMDILDRGAYSYGRKAGS